MDGGAFDLPGSLCEWFEDIWTLMGVNLGIYSNEQIFLGDFLTEYPDGVAKLDNIEYAAYVPSTNHTLICSPFLDVPYIYNNATWTFTLYRSTQSATGFYDNSTHLYFQFRFDNSLSPAPNNFNGYIARVFYGYCPAGEHFTFSGSGYGLKRLYVFSDDTLHGSAFDSFNNLLLRLTTSKTVPGYSANYTDANDVAPVTYSQFLTVNTYPQITTPDFDNGYYFVFVQSSPVTFWTTSNFRYYDTSTNYYKIKFYYNFTGDALKYNDTLGANETVSLQSYTDWPIPIIAYNNGLTTYGDLYINDQILTSVNLYLNVGDDFNVPAYSSSQITSTYTNNEYNTWNDYKNPYK